MIDGKIKALGSVSYDHYHNLFDDMVEDGVVKEIKTLRAEVKMLKEFVLNLSKTNGAGGDPDEECPLCMGELQENARQLLEHIDKS